MAVEKQLEGFFRQNRFFGFSKTPAKFLNDLSETPGIIIASLLLAPEV
jgi:hypothetical protein